MDVKAEDTTFLKMYNFQIYLEKFRNRVHGIDVQCSITIKCEVAREGNRANFQKLKRTIFLLC